MRRKTHYDRDALHFAPFVLFPSPFPEKNFDRIVNIQIVVNELFHKVRTGSNRRKLTIFVLFKVAHDYEFLRETLRNTVEVDEFTGKLWSIYQTICDEGGPTQVTILRLSPPAIIRCHPGQPWDDEVRLHAG